MNRAEWLKKMRKMAEALYDHISPAYWVKYGQDLDASHREFSEKFLGRLEPQSAILDAACGAGLYDGMLISAGHQVLGIDLSGGMLAQARQHFPQERYPNLHYAQMGLQEMSLKAEFDGLICVDALEHICPEDWPRILARFHKALKPGGVLYVTVDALELGEYGEAYERARAMGLPVVFGEVVDELDTAYAQATALEALDPKAISGDRLDHSVYHFHPSMQQVRAWFDQARLEIIEEGVGDEYWHLLARAR
jgi:2-polyprenyl-3-methyl-5-hydroxy-6-metoxy-1,4-benzoquinol methylase